MSTKKDKKVTKKNTVRKKSVVPIYVFAGVWFLYAMIGKLYTLPQLLIAAGITIFNNPWWHESHSFVKVIGGVILFAAAAGFVRLILVWPIRKK